MDEVSFANDLSAVGVDPSMLQRVDISDPDGLENFLNNLEENFNGNVSSFTSVPGHTFSASVFKNKLINWADQQVSNERKKEIHLKIAEFIKRLEAYQEQEHPEEIKKQHKDFTNSMDDSIEETESKNEEKDESSVLLDDNENENECNISKEEQSCIKEIPEMNEDKEIEENSFSLSSVDDEQENKSVHGIEIDVPLLG